jgi:hypothetical protein
MTRRTIVYVDGFNLYYGLLRHTPYEWLDLDALCKSLLRPSDQLLAICYYTALVQPLKQDPNQQQRQLTFLRALKTIPHLTIHYGHFLAHTVRMPLVHPPENGPRTVEVIRTEEKGSDVNLACHLLLDAFQNCFDLAVVLSGDSDLAEPIRIVRTLSPNHDVGVWNPQRIQSVELRRYATFYKHIRRSILPRCQFPPVLTGEDGKELRKPTEWD